MSTTYRLEEPAPRAGVPPLDEHQRRVVDHPGGPLLVLAGPGTGKTTTLVEAVVDRIEQRGARPDEVLALTFSRKAADELRDRITARLGRTMSGTPCSTFHSFAYGLIRAYAPQELYEAPLRLLSAPEADVVLRELLADHPESVRWPEGLRRALGTRGFAREVQAVLSRAREKGLEGEDLRLFDGRSWTRGLRSGRIDWPMSAAMSTATTRNDGWRSRRGLRIAPSPPPTSSRSASGPSSGTCAATFFTSTKSLR